MTYAFKESSEVYLISSTYLSLDTLLKLCYLMLNDLR